MSHHFMKRALELAQHGSGFTSPNPLVGAVLVKEGRIIGEGYHPRFGEQHAEAMAISSAREPVEGAELFCTLEPCTPTIPNKKTPACSLRIIREKIGKVHIATLDPNPHVQGKGVEALHRAGIPVEVGLMAREALALNEPYFKFIQQGKPFIHLKIAASLDGRIAAANGDSRWITDQAARTLVHRWRARYDAVLIGVDTAICDDPQLTVRLCSGPQPYRIVLDSRLRIPENSRLLRDQFAAKTIIFAAGEPPPEKLARLRRAGMRVEIVPADEQGQTALPQVLEQLGRLSISSVLVEGGSKIFTAFIRQRCFDKLSIFYAPLIIGTGRNAIGELNTGAIAGAMRLERVAHRSIGNQLIIEGYRNYRESLGNFWEKDLCLPELSKPSAL